jgi:molecular chaperone GrpE
VNRLKDDKGPVEEKGEVERLNEELKERDEELEKLRLKIQSLQSSDIETELDETQKFIEDEKRRSEDYLRRLKYLQADFENYRKRVDREMRDVEDFSTSNLIKKLLPALDDLDLAIASADQGHDAKGLLEGVVMVRKNLASALQSEGLRDIEAVGKPFDPDLHEAVERVDGTTGSTDMVIGEIRKGYILKNRVLRPSMVKVESASKDNGEKE